MSGLQLSNITKKFGQIIAVQDINLEIPNGKFVSFLGPSGCGKTTLLRMIAGLEKPTDGAILLDGEDITPIPTHQRSIGMVFQSLALFPHLSVGDNVTYGLRIRGMDKAKRRTRAGELLELVRLPGVESRRVSQLSGGQRQRVAIARALALEPKLFLLDEPLSALDAKLREEMQVELRMLQERLGITTVIVTHDQREAMTMSDEVVVMSTAKIQQVGAPLEIYRTPATAFVAEFIGTSNLMNVKVVNNGEVEAHGERFAVEAIADGLAAGSDAVLSIRPEEVHVVPSSNVGPNQMTGKVTFVRDVGASIETFVDCGDLTVVGLATPKERPDIGVGDEVRVELPAEACVVVKP